jgi:hypothetical protein
MRSSIRESKRIILDFFYSLCYHLCAVLQMDNSATATTTPTLRQRHGKPSHRMPFLVVQLTMTMSSNEFCAKWYLAAAPQTTHDRHQVNVRTRPNEALSVPQRDGGDYARNVRSKRIVIMYEDPWANACAALLDHAYISCQRLSIQFGRRPEMFQMQDISKLHSKG